MTVQFYNSNNNNKHSLARRIERKFYLPPNLVGLAYGLLRHFCLPAEEYPSEQINSVYFDTTDLDQHERSLSGDFIKDKVRIRWYGKDDITGIQTIFIELKSKEGFASTKQRLVIEVPTENLAPARLGRGIVLPTLLVHTLAGFGHFHSEILQPIVKISYWRYRFSDVVTGQRVSLDCHIRSTMIIPGHGNGERDLELPGGVIEIKGLTMELPPTLGRMRLLDIDWGRFSKYSACIDSHVERQGALGRLSPQGKVFY